MPDKNVINIAALMNANNTLFNVLIRALDERGIISRAKLRESLLNIVRESQADPGTPRMDILQFQNLANLLEDCKPLEAQWKPIVVQGGRSD